MVDDSAAVRDAICDFIDRATPFKACCEAGNGDAAINKVRERAPALVILDLSIPMDGVETASALRRMVPDTKIIGLGMFAGEFRRTLIAAAGFDMILFKHEGLASWPKNFSKCPRSRSAFTESGSFLLPIFLPVPLPVLPDRRSKAPR